MWRDLIFSLGIVMPLFVVLFLGYGLRRFEFLNASFAAAGTKFVFYAALPATLARSIYRSDIHALFDARFVAFLLVVTVVTFFIIWAGAAVFIKDKPILGAFVQTAFRGNVAFMGLPLLINLAGDAGALRGAMMVTFALPVVNVLSIVVLTVCDKDNSQIHVGRICLSIIKNPLIIGILAGVGLSLSGVTLPVAAGTSVNYIADMATPLALLCLGASLSFAGFDVRFKYAIWASVVKVVALPVVFVGLGYVLGFRGYDLAALMVVGGVPSAIAGYAMVVQMGGDGYVAGTIVMISTLMSAFTLTVFIYAFRVLGVLG